MSTSCKWWTLIGLSLASSFVFTELVMVSTILGALQVHLKATYTELQWILNIYILVTSVFMITMGRFGDIFGNRTMVLFGMVGFGASSFFAGISPNPEWMLVARGFQGFFGAIIIPCSLAIINNIFPDAQKGRVIGTWNALAMLGIAIAPLLATVLHELANWRWIFFIHIPLMILCLIITLFSLREELQVLDKQPIDWWGFIFLTVGATCLVVSVTQGFEWGWSSPFTLILLVIAAVAIFLWIITEMTQKSPIVNFGWFANKTFAGCVTVALVTISAGVVLLFLLPLYLHNILALGYVHIGLFLCALTFPAAVFSPVSGFLTDRFGHRFPIFIGSIFLIVSLYMNTRFSTDTSSWFLILSFILFGISWGMILGPVKTGVLNSLPHRKAGVGVGALLSFDHLGSTIFLAIMGTIFRRFEHTFLENELIDQGIEITRRDVSLIQMLLSHPLKVS